MASCRLKWNAIRKSFSLMCIVVCTICVTFVIDDHLSPTIIEGKPESRNTRELDNPGPEISPADSWRTLAVDADKLRKAKEIFPPNSSVPTTVNSPYLIENKVHCGGILSLKYVVVVHSAPRNINRRLSMRGTWAKQNLFEYTNTRTVFLLGATQDESLQEDIRRESDTYGDIVQGSFNDHYMNLTLKAVMGLRWLSENCRHADFVMKVDDDVFVNVPQVIRHIFPVLQKHPKNIVCLAENDGPIFRLGAAPKGDGKWIASCEYFRYSQTYPMPFCYGFATFYSISLASELFEAAKSTPFYPFDDVFVYGVLASKVKGLKWTSPDGTFFKSEDTTLEAVKSTNKGLFLVGTARSKAVMEQLWKQVSANV